MELLLKKNVEKLGRVGDVVKVRDGYARNFLLPKGLATNVTPANLKQIEKEKMKMDMLLKEERDRLQGVLEKISAASCTITARANAEGRLFGSISSAMIAEALAKEGYPVEEEMVVLDVPIKTCGVFDVTVSLNIEMKTKCKVTVVADESSQPVKE